MAVRKIRTIGDPVLREVSSRIENIDKPVISLIRDMKDTLESMGGVGLAAPQIGVSKRVIIISYDGPVKAYINPEIEILDEDIIESEEGCLSIFSIHGFTVNRHPKVRVKAIDTAGKEIEVTAEGLLARIFQHEIDHLNGVLFMDHLNKKSRNELLGKIFEIGARP
ncbi:MAG: peptide deformylase [Actinobacteria bacterium]|nr:peptide deformylase [Actinomycetota bacterium]